MYIQVRRWRENIRWFAPKPAVCTPGKCKKIDHSQPRALSKLNLHRCIVYILVGCLRFRRDVKSFGGFGRRSPVENPVALPRRRRPTLLSPMSSGHWVDPCSAVVVVATPGSTRVCVILCRFLKWLSRTPRFVRSFHDRSPCNLAVFASSFLKQMPKPPMLGTYPSLPLHGGTPLIPAPSSRVSGCKSRWAEIED